MPNPVHNPIPNHARSMPNPVHNPIPNHDWLYPTNRGAARYCDSDRDGIRPYTRQGTSPFPLPSEAYPSPITTITLTLTLGMCITLTLDLRSWAELVWRYLLEVAAPSTRVRFPDLSIPRSHTRRNYSNPRPTSVPTPPTTSCRMFNEVAVHVWVNDGKWAQWITSERSFTCTCLMW